MEISGEFILIATGSSPVHSPDIPFDGKLIYDSDSILNMDHIPKTMAVVAGGVIGTEYASIVYRAGHKSNIDRAARPHRLLCRFGDRQTPHGSTHNARSQLYFW